MAKYKPRERYVSLEAPDDICKIDFLGGAEKNRACMVKLVYENGKLWVKVTGCDDRATILIDQEVEIPEEDKRT